MRFSPSVEAAVPAVTRARAVESFQSLRTVIRSVLRKSPTPVVVLALQVEGWRLEFEAQEKDVLVVRAERRRQMPLTR